MTGSDTTGPAAILVQVTRRNPGGRRIPAAADRPRRSWPSESADCSGRPKDPEDPKDPMDPENSSLSRPDATDMRPTRRPAAQPSELPIHLVGEKSQVLEVG